MNAITFQKPNRYVDTVFIHCSASDNPEHDDISVIRKWHLKKGWSDVGYHYFIKKNGVIQRGRDLEKTPAAQRGYNRHTIAICIHGLELNLFSGEELASLRILCETINKAYNWNLRFRGHNEVNPNKTCPVINIHDVLILDANGYMV